MHQTLALAQLNLFHLEYLFGSGKEVGKEVGMGWDGGCGRL